MKYLTRISAVALLFIFVGTASASTLAPKVDPDLSKVNWKKYSRALVDGIRSDNDGVREAAMRLSIQYSANVDVSDAMVDLMRIYRNAENNKVRRMAALTLASIDSDFADGYLRMSSLFERNDGVRQTLRALAVE